MPYEGFTREVIPELVEYREENQQEGPPKEWLDEHSQEVIEEPEEGELPLEEPAEESENHDQDAGDEAAEAIADQLEDFEAAASEDAS